MRIGHGYDLHKLVDDRKLILGGVEIPHEKGLLGHSDADVLTHAIIDSLLGAANLGDIGKFFPNTDDSFKNISSIKLLKKVLKKLKKEGFKIINIDSTIVAEKPKLASYTKIMSKNVEKLCDLKTGSVSIKATTEEGLFECAIRAYSVCLLKVDKKCETKSL